jgi:hypothetical protein
MRAYVDHERKSCCSRRKGAGRGSATHGGELRGRGRVERVARVRKLVDEGGHVHFFGAMEALDAVQRPDLRPQSADHEVLEDP